MVMAVQGRGRVRVTRSQTPCQNEPMSTTTSSFQSNADGTQVTTYTWAQTPGQPVGVVQISHGLAEHGERYDRFERALNAAGFIVHAVDHRGHGRTAGGKLGDFGSAGFNGLIADVAQFGARSMGSSFRFSCSATPWAPSQRRRPSWTTRPPGPASSCQAPPPSTCSPPAWPTPRPTRPLVSRRSTQALSTAPATNGCRATLPRWMPTWPTRGAAGTCRTT